MKHIQNKYLNLGLILVFLFALSLIGGIYKRPFLIGSGFFLAAYFILQKKKLVCPNCGVTENLDRLIYAKKHIYHCRHCGEIIKILK